MWYPLRKSSEAQADFVAATTELLQTTSRNLILATGIAYMVWYLVATIMWPKELGWNVMLVTPVVLLTSVISPRLHPERPFT